MMISVAVVGFGYWGPNLARNLAQLPGVSLAEIVDADPKRLDRARQQFPHARFSANYLFALNNPQIDAVAIATPAGTHYEMARTALQHGKHVLVEKPLALTVEEGEELVALAEKAGLTLMVDHTYEYHPAVAWMERVAADGELGSILYATSTRLNLGIVRQDVNALWNLAPHDVAMILRLFAEEPSSVEATGGCYLQKGIEDVVSLCMRFPSGRIAQVTVSWLSPHRSRELTLVGDKKMVVFEDTLSEERVKIYDKGVSRQAPYESYGEYFTARHGDIVCPMIPNAEPLRLAAEDFVKAIAEKRAPRSDGIAALRVLRVLASAEAALARRR